jgi:hypothetical protein
MRALGVEQTAFTAEEYLEKSVPVSEGGTLYVNLDRGSVEVTSHDLPEVRVVASGRGWSAGMVHFSLMRHGRDVELDGDVDGWLAGWLFPMRVEVRAWVPRRYSVEITTRGGSIRVSEVGGSVAAQTSGGRVELNRIDGAALLRTSGGRILVEEVNGDVSARTSGGRIDVSFVNGDVEARTSGGPIEVLGAAGAVDAKTSGGRIVASFVDDPAGRLETSGGSIEVTFPEDARADLDAKTSGGRVRVDHEVAFTRPARKHHFVGEINGGGMRLSLRTSGGSIHVRAA